MWHRIPVLVVLGGCGFQASASQDGNARDAAVPDTGALPVDGQSQIDGVVTPADCLAHWLDGSVALSAPQELASLSSNGSERDPWISSDRLTLYYGVKPTGAASDSDIYRARRTATDQPFGTATALVNLNRTDADESRAALTPDEKMLVLASNRVNSNDFDIYLISRGDTTVEFGSPDTTHLGAVNGDGASNFDPFLTADGKKLYLAPLAGGSPQHIFVATRTNTSSDFSAPVAVPGIGSQSIDADPALSLDERIILFSSTRNGGIGGTDLWYATRQNANVSFGMPKLVPGVNSTSSDGDPMLSADGCELYFSSTRTGDDYDLYTAQITK
jgi:Tol biopolymer transport system component